MKLKSNNKGVSSVVAASILLAALVTAAVTFQAFIVPELDREKAFAHSQDVLYSFEKLYSEGKTTLPLSYSGATPFFSPTSFTGQLSYIPSVTLKVDVSNATYIRETEILLSESANLSMQSLSNAAIYFKNVSDNIEATCNFTNSEEQTVFQIHTEQLTYGDGTLMRIQLNITLNSESTSYNYSIVSGDSLELSLFSPLYNTTTALSRTSHVQYTTNSSSCMLFLKYMATTTDNLSYTSSGAIRYKPGNFPLSYLATPWGITAIEIGTSAIPSPMQIYWAKDTLVLDLYNTTWSNIGTIGGSGPIGIQLKTYDSISVNSKFSRLDMNFSSSDIDLKNSVLQLEAILQSGTPEGVSIYHQEGADWLTITVEDTEGAGSVSILIRSMEAVLG